MSEEPTVEETFARGLRGVVEVGLEHLSDEEREKYSNDIEPNLLLGDQEDRPET